MMITERGRIAIAAMLALAFSALLFQDVILLILLCLVSISLLVEFAWTRLIAWRPEKWFSASLQSGMLAPQTLYAGRGSSSEFTLTKKGAGSAWVSSDLEFLKFMPAVIRGKDRKVKISAEFATQFAGEYVSKRIKILVSDPLELFSAECAVPFGLKYTVLPRLLEVAVTSSKILGKGGVGEIAVEKLGIGTEFYEIRSWQIGDELKHVNWKATARKGELMVNEFSKELGPEYYLILEAVALEYFERDRLASTFLQLANALAMLNVRFGVLVHDRTHVRAVKKIDLPIISLQFALESALEFAQVGKQKAFSQQLGYMPSSRLKRSRDTLLEQNYATLGAILDSGLSNVKAGVHEEVYEAILDLVKERNSEEPLSVLYVTAMSGPLEKVLELGSEIRNVYNSDFMIIDPSAPWITAPSEDEACDLYQKYEKKLRSLVLAGIEYSVGDPVEIAQRLFAT